MSDGAYARFSDPSTSSEAADSVSVAKAEMVVLTQLLKRPVRGATSDEMADITGIARVTVSPRFRPLERKGLIEDSGERRKGNSGRTSIVWRPTSRAVEMYATTQRKRRKTH